MSSRNDSRTTAEPFRRTRLVEACSLGVQLHIPREDAWPEDPWVVKVILSSLDEKNLEVVVQVCESRQDGHGLELYLSSNRSEWLIY